MGKWIFGFLAWTFLLSAQTFKQADINSLMNQLLERHVNKKSWTPALLQASVNAYVEQFDPERLYLIESEAAPFQHLTPEALQEIQLNMQKGTFPLFLEMNGVFQKAILRAREERAKIMAQEDTLLNKEAPAPSALFATNLVELSKRQQEDMIRYLMIQKSRIGEPLLRKNLKEAVATYQLYLTQLENRYLLVDEQGQPLANEEKENQVALHILKALAASLDAHTTFFDEREANEMRVRLEKERIGVGIAFIKTADGIQVVGLVKGGSAERSGHVEVHDKLVELNGKNIEAVPFEQVMNMLEGPLGSSLNLVFSHQGHKQAVTLVREKMEVNEDRADLYVQKEEGGVIGVVKLDSFYQGDNGITTEADVRKALQQLGQQGAIQGIILDLRDNSGGFISQAVKVAGLFITNGVILVSKYANGEERFYRDMDNQVLFEGPLIVLTSKATASAAEIVAQALQDYGVALIVGDEQTYGKGTIQSQTVTDNKGGSYFKVTVGKYYTVSGKTPQLNGVKADIVVPSPLAKAPIGEEYVEQGNLITPDAIPSSYKDELSDINPRLKSWYMKYYIPTLQQKEVPWTSQLSTLTRKSQVRQATPSSSPDPQLFEALNILKDMIQMQKKTVPHAIGDPH